MMKRAAMTLFLMAALAYATMVGFLYVKQDSILFGTDRTHIPPAKAGLPDVTEVQIKTPDGETLLAWSARAAEGMPTVLFFHGKGGTISGRPKRYDYYTSRGLGLLALEYRGYGGSSGMPSEAGFMIDAETAYRWLMDQGVAPKSVVIVGESLGTAIATKLAARVEAGALLLEAPYSSVVDVAAERYWFAPVRVLIRHQFNAIADVGRVKMPILIHHGTADETVPYKFGQLLYEAAPAPKEFIKVPGAGHVIFNAATWAAEMDFLNRKLGLNIRAGE